MGSRRMDIQKNNWYLSNSPWGMVEHSSVPGGTLNLYFVFGMKGVSFLLSQASDGITAQRKKSFRNKRSLYYTGRTRPFFCSLPHWGADATSQQFSPRVSVNFYFCCMPFILFSSFNSLANIVSGFKSYATCYIYCMSWNITKQILVNPWFLSPLSLHKECPFIC